jgi:hypothetical protein
MDLIKSLEAKFQNLDDNKLTTLTNTINTNYDKDCAKINDEIFNSIQNQYENGLHEHREQMLKQLIQNRDDQLSKVNDIKEIMEPDQEKTLNQLKSLAEEIKLKQDEFAHGLISINDSILNRTKLESHLNLGKMLKYTLFTTKQNTYKLDKLKKLHKIDIFQEFHQISTDLLFIWFDSFKKRVIDDYMVVLNRNGEVLKSKKML